MYNKNKDEMDNREKFYGFYRGKVVDVDDPYKVGRIRVEIYGVFDGLSVNTLPWAIYADTLMGGQQDLGGFIIPDLESHVWVFFEEGDHTQPVYFAGAPARPHGPPQKTNGEYPRNKTLKTKTGYVFEIDDSPNQTRLHIHHPSGNDYLADNKGNIEELIVGNVDRHTEGNVNEQIDKNLEVRVEESVLVSCPLIDLGESSDLEQSVLGKKLENWINNELVPWLNSHGHQSAPPGPSAPPTEPFEPGTAEPGGIVWSKKNRNQ